MSTLIPILIFILILGIVVFVHEMGHYLAARRAGVYVEEFALGMGPLLFGFHGKPVTHMGERTLYSVRLFPIGGFCKMRGNDEESDADDPYSLNNKTIKQRALVMAGGSFMNFLMAFILFFVLTMLTGYLVAEVRGLQEGFPAYESGLQVGDRITHINGNRVTLYANFELQMEFSGGQPLDVRFVRDGVRHNITVTPVQVVRTDGSIAYRLGFRPDFRYGLLETPGEGFRRVGVWSSVTNAAEMMVFNIRIPFTILARWLTNEPIPDGAGAMGPIGMAGQVTQIYQRAIQHSVLDMVLDMLFFTALINAALGLMNLLPIPALDGARLVFLAIEGIRRKPIPPEREGMVHLAGFALMIGLAIFIAYRDIVRLTGGV
ncbi:MAG: M50 family metallopeptidase [Defluviitaleaceae bacterium]|nr:M50 family metallopeptidase [Defluviitaleaceae bacterium]MCL2274349.1 M50 family metallopeptidase [Defluviitaleaceae bacterium]